MINSNPPKTPGLTSASALTECSTLKYALSSDVLKYLHVNPVIIIQICLKRASLARWRYWVD